MFLLFQFSWILVYGFSLSQVMSIPNLSFLTFQMAEISLVKILAYPPEGAIVEVFFK